MITEIDGIKINYVDKGEKDAPVLFVLHGWGCDETVYSAITDGLAARYRVILPELPGFGQSEEPPEPWGVGDYADFANAFMNALDVKPEVVLAHSLGGRIVIKSTGSIFLPETKIILTGAAGIKHKPTKAQLRKSKMFKLQRTLLKPFPPLVEQLRKKYGSEDYRNATPIMRQSLVKIVNEDLTELLPLLKQEVLLIWGENDDSTPLSDGKLMESSMPNAGLALISNAGHYAFLEQPKWFMDIVNAFV